MSRKATKLDTLIDEAVVIVQKLEGLDHDRKLTYPAFLKEAIAVAETTIEKVNKLNNELEQRPGTLHAQQFVSKLVKVFREPNYPRCPSNPGRVLNAYGSNEAFQELTGIGATVAQAMAVAIIRVHERFGDEAFGIIKNWNAYDKEYTTHRDRLSTLHEEMRSACTNADLAFDDTHPAVLPSERARGLCRVSFKRAAGISPSMGDWPQQIIADAVANVPKSKPKRERITRAA